MLLYNDYLNAIGDREKWQMTSMELKLFSFDWRLIFAFVPVIFAMTSIYSYIFALTLILFCQFLKFRGVSLPTLLRSIEFRIVGRRARGKYKYETIKYRS